MTLEKGPSVRCLLHGQRFIKLCSLLVGQLSGVSPCLIIVYANILAHAKIEVERVLLCEPRAEDSMRETLLQRLARAPLVRDTAVAPLAIGLTRSVSWDGRNDCSPQV